MVTDVAMDVDTDVDTAVDGYVISSYYSIQIDTNFPRAEDTEDMVAGDTEVLALLTKLSPQSLVVSLVPSSTHMPTTGLTPRLLNQRHQSRLLHPHRFLM